MAGGDGNGDGRCTLHRFSGGGGFLGDCGGVVRQQFQKVFFIKLADKHDPVLLATLLQAGVEYLVLRASFQSAAAKAFLTALVLWLPLLPVFWLLRRISNRSEGVAAAETACLFHLLGRLQQDKRAADAEVQKLAGQVLSVQQDTGASADGG
ncbi:hypothetical protein PLESTB_000623200 [Pleodorina starrii]|uniref:Uncharacterized protein n=1 Tax=Pleodorina starrii TaxID=330485 RepID=A0A9W6BHT1_9CHLO|nr:hypothetical protein PLESTB_000623200 [Pleodorina starrii]